ncbi:MAG: type II toxin-antitoxin system VapC family toxin [Anaerolineae bacterium]|nr:type II toxin-antitoxin system VapC family toxin [Anaerolineae bacterium]
MKLLLDTHIFLWYITGDQRLPLQMGEAIRDVNNDVYLSVVSVWEATVKYQLGKLPLPQSPDIYLSFQRQQHQIASLSLDEISVGKLSTLPLLHRDPFDRMLICQALAHNLMLVTVDDTMSAYAVSILRK